MRRHSQLGQFDILYAHGRAVDLCCHQGLDIALESVLQPDQIDVLCTQPGLTTTTSTTTSLHKQQQQPGAGSMFANPDVVARNALNLLSVTQQKRVIPTPLHAFFVFLMEHVLPESWQDSLNRSAGLERLQRIHTAVPITEVSVLR